ncbi:AraC family transcriptional regulator [Nocardioides scoriae]|uniref:AraC family transcriptional regulator n=1 Tax=Nocardioides scoriae TaxID=642780 RepID=UPI0012FA71FA|nr:AraC family transcriptional regulator [Nocardioides scoriae]
MRRHYLPNRLRLPRSATLEMSFSGLRIGAVTAGRLSYGQEVQQRTGEADHFHVDMPVRGRALSGRGSGEEPVLTTVGQPLVFSPGAPAEITWSADCAQLCLMVPRPALEGELERLLGRSVRSGLRFDFDPGPTGSGDRTRAVLDLVAQEVAHPSGLLSNDVAGRHVEGLLLDSLLLGHRHNYSDDAAGGRGSATGRVVRRAAELLEGRPEEPWTTVGLAAEVHLSVRALQAGFQRDLGTTPMAHLRAVRLRRAHRVLREADPGSTTVQAVAVGLGLLHQGRFAAQYREAFGETPSQTLAS